jgi:hypothetical protein
MEWDLRKPNQPGLSAITASTLTTLFNLSENIRAVRIGVNQTGKYVLKQYANSTENAIGKQTPEE